MAGSKRALISGLVKGEPFVSKLAVFGKYAVLPGAMVAALIFSPPSYSLRNKDPRY